MKVIIKILEYLSERDAVVFRTCRLNSHKPIDEHPEKVVDCFDLNKNDIEKKLKSRDITDSSRKNSPLRIDEDAHLINTDNLNIDQVVMMIKDLIPND